MRVCIFTLGSRGDVQPYLALAQELIRCGHKAVLCTGGSFRTLIESHGVSFIETSSDLMVLAKTAEGKAVMEHPVRNFHKALALTKNVINPAYRKTLHEFLVTAQDADCIVYHPKALGAVDIALYYDIPCISMPPTPTIYPIREFANLACTTRNLGPWLNRMSYQINGMAERPLIKLINDFRVHELSWKPRKPGIYTLHDEKRDIPIMYPMSRLLFPEVTSWNDRVFLPGCFYTTEKDNDLPDKLQKFLSSGPQPIAITFSSMPLKSPNRFLSNLKAALQRSNNRAVLLTGNSGIDCDDTDRVCVLSEVSHQVLFSHVKAVIHHGGVGTTAAVLRAGIPQLIMPFSVDQPFWAKRMQLLGVGVSPLKEKNATPDLLVRLMLELESPAIVEKAASTGKIIREEDGVKNATHIIENMVEKWPLSQTRS